MGYQYSGDDLNTYKNELIKSINKLEGMFDSLIKNADPAFQDPSWKGQTADSFVKYYETIYKPVAVQLSALCSCLKDCLNIYYACYINFVDGDSHAVIYAEEIDKLSTKLSGRDTEAAAIQSALVEQVDTISDIADGFSIKDPGITDNVIFITQTIKDMYDRIDCTEGRIKSDLTGFISAYQSLQNLILVGRNNAHISSDGTSLELDEETVSKALCKVMESFAYLDGWKQANEKLILKAEEITEIDKAIRQRKGEADCAKDAVVGIAVLTHIALVLGTGGGSLWFEIIYGIVSGAIIEGVDEAGDQYVENGWENITWDDVGIHAVYGGIGGGAGGFVGNVAGSGFSHLLGHIPIIQQGLQSSNPVIQEITNTFIETTGAWLGGTTGNMAEEITNQLIETQTIDFPSVVESGFTDSGNTAETAVTFFSELYQGIMK